MSLPVDSNKVSYTVTSATSEFSFPYKYWDQSDLVVQVLSTATGLTETLTITTDYTVAATNGDPAQGAVITTNTSYDNHTVVIERIIPIQSESDFRTGDGIPPDALNSEFDKSAARTQQTEGKVDRQITHPATDPDGLIYEAPSALLRASKATGWDSAGNVVALDLASSGTIAADTSKGLSITSNIISSTVDDTSIGFDGLGKHEIKDSGVSTAKIADLAVTAAKLNDDVFQKIYPVGSVYTNASVGTNPATLFGIGTWTAFGTGRVLVGIDGGDADFNPIGKTSGASTHTLTEAEIPAHTHDFDYILPTYVGSGGAAWGNGVNRDNVVTDDVTESTGDGGAHNNLQPYIVVYMWLRTA